jgi:hypothetical protein
MSIFGENGNDDVRGRVESALLGIATTPNEPIADITAVELAHAEALSLTMADRLRSNTGGDIELTLSTHDVDSQRLRGRVLAVSSDHVILQGETGLVVVRLAGVVTVGGLAAGTRPAVGFDARWTWRGTLRRWVGDDVTAHLATLGIVRGRLLRVGADHIALAQLSGDTLVAWDHLAAVVNPHGHSIAADLDDA